MRKQIKAGRDPGFRGVWMARTRVFMASEGRLADGPELFEDLGSSRGTCAADGPTAGGSGNARVWSNAEAKATEREDGTLDLVVADGIANNRHYSLSRRAG